MFAAFHCIVLTFHPKYTHQYIPKNHPFQAIKKSQIVWLFRGNVVYLHPRSLQPRRRLGIAQPSLALRSTCTRFVNRIYTDNLNRRKIVT